MRRWRDFGIAVALLLLVVAVYGQVYRFQFINYDDGEIAEDPHIRTGLSVSNVRWALTTGMDYWRPLTRLSHMAVCHVFGLNAGAHHVVNVVLHAFNVVLLFVLLRRMTGAPWRSGFVAALFAVHPLHVESVAWVTERKDVLSALFWMLTLWCYARWVEQPQPGRYALICVCFALGLMAKPMLVTLPAALLLLDYWPLRRVGIIALKRRVIEKLPLFGLALAAGLTTFLVQLRAGSLTRLEDLPVGARICNAVVSYGVYLAKTAWPSHLAVIYPHGKWPPLWQVIGTTVMLAGLTAGAMWMARRRTYLLVGWLWYLGTLMPVIGFAQSGAQAYADRFVYLPLIGIYLAIVWGASDLRPDRRYRIVAGAMVLAGLMVASFRQVSHWRNSVSLFEHAVAVTRDNAIAHDNLGLALTGEKRYDEGIAQYREAWRLNPTSTTAHGYIGTALAEQGRHAEALGYLREAARLNPKDAKHRIDLADTLTALDRLDEAVVQYREAIRLKTDVGWVYYQLAWRLAKLGRWAEAVSEYRESLRLTPDQPEALSALAWLLATCPDDAVRDGAESVRLAERASQKRAGDPSTLDVLAAAYAETGRYEDAIRTAEKARQLATSRADIEKRLALYGRRQPYRQTQP